MVGALLAALMPLPVLASQNVPNSFRIISPDKNGQPPAVRLNGGFDVRLLGDIPDVSKIDLLLDGTPVGAIVQKTAFPGVLLFTLPRTDHNQAMWVHLLGAPFGRPREILEKVVVTVDGKELPVTAGAPKKDEVSDSTITLERYNRDLIALALFLTATIILATALKAKNTTMMRDASITQLSVTDRPFSLGRFQMTFWFCLVFASFVFILALTFDLNSISTQAFELMGISAATALGSVAIDQSKNDAVVAAQNEITALGIKTADDVEKLKAVVRSSADGPAAAAIPGAAVPGNPNPTVSTLWDAYLKASANFRTDGFFKDLVNDVNGPTIHRWQILIWTLVLGVIYVWTVYAQLKTPDFPENLLILMGISGGVYLGFKIPEKLSA